MVIATLIIIGDVFRAARDLLAIIGLLSLFASGMVGVLIWADSLMDAATKRELDR